MYTHNYKTNWSPASQLSDSTCKINNMKRIKPPGSGGEGRYHRWSSQTQGMTFHDGTDEALFIVSSRDLSSTCFKHLRAPLDCYRVQRIWHCSTVPRSPLFSFVDAVELPYLARLVFRVLPSVSTGWILGDFPGDLSNFHTAFLKTRFLQQ